MRRKTARLLISLSIIWLLCSLPWHSAAEDEFKAIVNHIESHFHVKRTRIPLFGMANFAFKVAHPHGIKNVKLAVFEDQHFDMQPANADALDTVVRDTLSHDWQPIVRVRSRADHEETYVYAKEAGKDLDLIVVTVEPDEATVVQVKMDPQRLSQWLSQPSTRRHWQDLTGGDQDRDHHSDHHTDHDDDDDND